MKFIKSIFRFIKDAIVETINQLFTLLGFFVGWIVLEGSAKEVVGWATIWVFVIWILTIWLRKEE